MESTKHIKMCGHFKVCKNPSQCIVETLSFTDTKQTKKIKQITWSIVFTFFMTPEATSKNVTAKWNTLIFTHRIKTKDYTVKSETIYQQTLLLPVVKIHIYFMCHQLLCYCAGQCPTELLQSDCCQKQGSFKVVTMQSFDSSRFRR